MKKIFNVFVVLLLVVSFLQPSFVFAQSGGAGINCSSIRDVNGIVTCAISILTVSIYFLISFALVYTLYGAFRFIGAEGDSRDKWKDVIVHGIIGLFVMTSIWGLVSILTGTFNLDNNPISPPQLRTTGTSGASNTYVPVSSGSSVFDNPDK